ncbi:MAG: DUF2779 domain-containing protein [Bacteroidales bacterium]
MAEKSKKALLSKSTFIKGIQCRKALYLYKNRYFLRDPLSPEQRAKFVRGTDVGIFARQLFPGGMDASPATHFQMAKSVEKTAALIAEGSTDVIYEAAFAFDDVVVALDILYRKDGKWHGAEVKSSRSLSETYHWDAALQYYVISGSGMELADFSLVYINKDYVRQEAIDPWKLFVMESRLEDAKGKQDMVKELVAELKETIALKKSPEIPIGMHCHDPYPCDFIDHCWKKVPDTSVFLLKGVERELQFAWYHQGIEQVDQIPDEYKQMPLIASQLKSISDRTPVLDKELLQKHFHGSSGKGLIMNTFVFAPAIPLFVGTQPYQILPFAVGWQDLASGKAYHWLDEPGTNDTDQTARKILEIAREYDTIWVFDLETEKNLLGRYSLSMPQLAAEFALIEQKFRGLKSPLEENWIVHPHHQELNHPEQFLTHFGVASAKLPRNLQIRQEADVLYQRLSQTDSPQEIEDGTESLQHFIKGKMKNIHKLYQLFCDLSA